ncbi:pyridoxal-5'-phosphate-dependent enzyme [Apiospora marii]|uniref:pyridoxal-5'-phosphate-dependent enzyme n=1 Tax=Apiospora marii TaxID=335849 RepID=UPI00313107EE
MSQLTYDSIVQAQDRLESSVTRTPCILSRELSSRLGRNMNPRDPSMPRVLLKLENLQKGGSFKYRGAMNALSQMGPDRPRQGHHNI